MKCFYADKATVAEANDAAEPISTDDRAIDDSALLDEGESPDERVVFDDGLDDEDSGQIALSLPGQQQQTVVRILPSVEAVVENEIWQYRYPPFFDNIVSADDLETGGRPGAFGSARSSFRLNRDALPSYVIGILDPSELVEGLFQPPVRRDSPQSSDSAKDGDANKNGRNLEQPSIPEGVPKVILDSDDRWVWSKASSRF